MKTKLQFIHYRNSSDQLMLFDNLKDFQKFTDEYYSIAEDLDHIICPLSAVEDVKQLMETYDKVDCYFSNSSQGIAASESLLDHWLSIGKERAKFGFFAPFKKPIK